MVFRCIYYTLGEIELFEFKSLFFSNSIFVTLMLIFFPLNLLWSNVTIVRAAFGGDL